MLSNITRLRSSKIAAAGRINTPEGVYYAKIYGPEASSFKDVLQEAELYKYLNTNGIHTPVVHLTADQATDGSSSYHKSFTIDII